MLLKKKQERLEDLEDKGRNLKPEDMREKRDAWSSDPRHIQRKDRDFQCLQYNDKSEQKVDRRFQHLYYEAKTEQPKELSPPLRERVKRVT